jgi:hypothetical protein
MLTTSEKNAVKKILKVPAIRRVELQTLLDAFNNPEVEIDIRQTITESLKVKAHVNSPKRIGLKKAGVVEFDTSVVRHQSNKIISDITSDLAVLLEWELNESIEAF